MTGLIGVIWGLAGVVLLIGLPLFQLSHFALEIFSFDLQWFHWLALIGMLIFMMYSEGYKGFQKSLSPRVAARAKFLYHHPTILRVVLAPLFCMGYFDIIRRRQIALFILTLGIVIIVFVVRMLEQPWKGIVDAGVVVGLSWGLISIMIFTLQAFTSPTFAYSPEVPENIA